MCDEPLSFEQDFFDFSSTNVVNEDFDLFARWDDLNIDESRVLRDEDLLCAETPENVDELEVVDIVSWRIFAWDWRLGEIFMMNTTRHVCFMSKMAVHVRLVPTSEFQGA